MKFSRQFWSPGGVLLLGAALIQLSPRAFAAVEPHLGGFCAVTLAAGAVLGCAYNLIRPVASLAVIGAAAWLLPALAAPGAPGWMLPTLAVLLPLNIILFALMPDYGLRARTSVLAAALLVLQAVTLPLLPRAAVSWIESHQTWAPLPQTWVRWSSVGQPTLLAFGLAATLLAGIFLWRRRPTDRALFWSLVAAFMGVQVAGEPSLALLYFGSGALIVALSLVEHAHELAYVDGLTGLPSRRALDEFLPQLNGSYALAIVDIDHFKRFNDAYGHTTGDQVLRKVAGHLAGISGRGRAFRFGGEEFAVVFSGRSRKESLPHLEALRARIEAEGFSLRGSLRPVEKPTERRMASRGSKKVPVTVSIGIAELGHGLETPEQVIQAADQAMYRAKQRGRNRVQAA